MVLFLGRTGLERSIKLDCEHIRTRLDIEFQIRRVDGKVLGMKRQRIL